MYRPYFFDRMSAGLDEKGMPVAWNHRFAGSSIIARWLPPAFNNGLDPDTTEGAIDLVYALPNMHVEYVRVEPPGIPTAFWRSVGPSHNVFVTESFMDELAAAAKQDPVAYRLALLDKSPRAKAVLELAAEKAGWGQPLPERVGRGVSLQFVFATYMAQVAEVEVSKDGAVRVRRVVCAVDCGTVVNPDTVQAQIQSAIIFGITAALYGEITLKDGRVEQTNFDTYQMLRMNEAPAIEVHIVQSLRAAGRDGRGRDLGHRSRGHQRDLCGNRQALAKAAGRHRRVEAAGVNGTPSFRPENRRAGLSCLGPPGWFADRPWLLRPNRSLDTRRDQMFPVLEPAEIERVRRFGKVRSYGAGEALAKVGEVGLGLDRHLAVEVSK